jgi:hypothetical protein
MRPNIPALTSLRFFAALVVVFFHYNLVRPLSPLSLGDFGYRAVTFFFVLSGFILAYAHGIPNGGLNVPLKTFIKARLVRITATIPGRHLYKTGPPSRSLSPSSACCTAAALGGPTMFCRGLKATTLVNSIKVGLFGGHREGDEAYLECIVREIHEEIVVREEP